MSANAATCVGTLDTDIQVSGERSHRVMYRVITTDQNDQSLTAIEAPGIPSIGSVYEAGNDSDYGAFVSAYSARLEDADGSRKIWEVIVTYSTAKQDNDTQQPGSVLNWEFPWLAPARVNGTGFKQEKQLHKHFVSPNGPGLEDLESSAGEPYDDVYGEYAILGLTIERDYFWKDWSIETARSYIDKVNSEEFWGAAAGYYKLAPPQYSLLFTGQGLPYWNVRYEFEGAAGFWNGTPHPDEGTYYRNAAGQIIRFADQYGYPLGNKGRLDGFGGALAAGLPTEYMPPGGINRYQEIDFADLDIPTSVENLLKGKNG